MGDEADTAEIETVEETQPGVGERLRVAREAKGLSLEDVAQETRIPERHLAVIERGEWDALPARTYAIGFSRTYARAVDLDEKEIAEGVRTELGVPSLESRHVASSFEPGDPSRVPSRGLAWASAIAAILLLAGGLAYFGDFFSPGAGPGSIIKPTPAAGAAAPTGAATPAPAAPVSGPVVFTALEDGIWVRFYDGKGERLLEKLMSKGETYTVPATADNPQLRTGRPDALGITIGGQTVPKLGDEPLTVSDIPVSAQALLDRGKAPATPPSTPTPTATP